MLPGLIVREYRCSGSAQRSNVISVAVEDEINPIDFGLRQKLRRGFPFGQVLFVKAGPNLISIYAPFTEFCRDRQCSIVRFDLID